MREEYLTVGQPLMTFYDLSSIRPTLPQMNVATHCIVGFDFALGQHSMPNRLGRVRARRTRSRHHEQLNGHCAETLRHPLVHRVGRSRARRLCRSS
jgi:hypothetical protein